MVQGPALRLAQAATLAVLAAMAAPLTVAARVPARHAVAAQLLTHEAGGGEPCVRCLAMRILLPDELLRAASAVTLTNVAGTLEYRGNPFNASLGSNDFAMEVS
jgi:hypothetical protein